jgi:hypothetical protein
MAKSVKRKPNSVRRAEPIKTARRAANVTQAGNGDPQVQLATRVNKQLYRELKLFAVTNNESISNLVGVVSGMAAAKVGIPAAQAKTDWENGLLKGVFLAPSGVYAVNRAQEASCTYCYAG